MRQKEQSYLEAKRKKYDKANELQMNHNELAPIVKGPYNIKGLYGPKSRMKYGPNT